MDAKEIGDIPISDYECGFLPVYEYGYYELPDGTRVEGNFIKEIQRVYCPRQKKPKIYKENGYLVLDFGA